MPEEKGNTEITIPTYRGMDIQHVKDHTILNIYSTTGKITIRCFHFHWEDNDEQQKK